MSITYAECCYYFACSFLWGVFSGVEYLFEKVDATEQYQRRTVWYDLQEDLSGWALNERMMVMKRYSTDKTIFSQLSRQNQNDGSELFVYATNLLLANVRRAYTTYPAISEAMWLYHAYCQWLWHILIAFEQFLQETPLDHTVFSRRYDMRAVDFKTLTQWMKDEQLTLRMFSPTEQHQLAPLLVNLETDAAHLAIQWRDTVITASNRIIATIK